MKAKQTLIIHDSTSYFARLKQLVESGVTVKTSRNRNFNAITYERD